MKHTVAPGAACSCDVMCPVHEMSVNSLLEPMPALEDAAVHSDDTSSDVSSTDNVRAARRASSPYAPIIRPTTAATASGRAPAPAPASSSTSRPKVNPVHVTYDNVFQFSKKKAANAARTTAPAAAAATSPAAHVAAATPAAAAPTTSPTARVAAATPAAATTATVATSSASPDASVHAASIVTEGGAPILAPDELTQDAAMPDSLLEYTGAVYIVGRGRDPKIPGHISGVFHDG